MKFHHKPVPVCALLAGLMFQLPVCAEQVEPTSASLDDADAKAAAKDDIEVVQVLGRRPFGLKLGSEKILNVAGAGNDPLRALEALPGVTLATPATGGPVARPAIRGSSPVDNEYQTDFLPVGYVFHNDGLSTINPLLIQSFSLYSSSWDPQYKDATGGVIITELRDPSFDQSGWFLDAGAIRSSMLYEGQLSPDTAFYFSLRQSFIHLYIDNFIEDEEFDFSTPPKNNDFQSKLVWDINDTNQLRVIATGAKDKVRRRFDEGSRDVAKNPDLASGEGYESSYQQLGLLWDNQSSLGDSKLGLNFLKRSEEIAEGISWNLDNDISEWLIKSATVSLLGSAELHWGAELKQQQIDWVAMGRAQPCNPELNVCPPGFYAPIRSENASVDVQFISGHLNYHQPLNENWWLKAGVALDQNDFTDESFAEPRLALTWQIHPDWQLDLTAGKHHQWFRRVEMLSEVFGNPELELEQDDHLGLGLEHRISSLWRWQLDLYHKKLDKLFVSNPARQATGLSQPVNVQLPAYLNGGSGTASGAEFLLNRDQADGWYGWLSVGYAKTERHNDLTGQDFNYEWDIPLIINVVLNYEWDEAWQVGMKWRYQSGRRFTEIFGAKPVYPQQNGQPDQSKPPIFYDPIEGELNGGRRNALHRLDARVDYRTQWGQYPVTMYFEVLNLYGSKTVQEQEWNADYSSYEDDYEFPDFPFPGLGITVRF
jgi:hypothetical protein